VLEYFFDSANGFLGTRASFMLDVVFVALFLLLPLLAISVYAVRYRRRYALHKKLQLVLAVVLLVTLVLFEVDIRISGWQHLAETSPYFAPVEEPSAVMSFLFVTLLRRPHVPGLVFITLAVHLVFAITTAVLWAAVTWRALRRFPHPPQPSGHSRSHIFWGQLAVADMCFTALTGWVFYWLAFVAK